MPITGVVKRRGHGAFEGMRTDVDEVKGGVVSDVGRNKRRMKKRKS